MKTGDKRRPYKPLGSGKDLAGVKDKELKVRCAENRIIPLFLLHSHFCIRCQDGITTDAAVAYCITSDHNKQPRLLLHNMRNAKM